MRKTGKRALSVCLVTVMVILSLAGCGKRKKATPEDLLNDIVKNLEEIESLESTMAMNMDLQEDDTQMVMETKVNMESNLGEMSAHLSGTVKMDYMGTPVELETEAYQVPEGEELAVYTLSLGVWTRDAISIEEAEAAKDFAIFEKLADTADQFERREDLIEIEGKKCFELNGTISGDLLDEMVNSQMFGSSLTDILPEDKLDVLKIPCTVSVYQESVLPARVYIDMTDMLNQALQGSDEEITVNAVNLDIIYKNYDSVDTIVVPDEALAAVGKTPGADGGDDGISKGTVSGSLGANWDCYQVQINDKVLTLPCTIAEMESAGLFLDTDYTEEDYVVNKNEYTLAYFEDARGNSVMVDLINMTGTPLSAKECMIGAISVSDYDLDEGGITVIFPGGIQMGTSLDDVLAKYGNTDDVYKGETLHMYTWSDNESFYRSCEIDFDADTGEVCEMIMEHYE